MTTHERVQFLEARGFAVARVPYLPGVFYMRELLPGGCWEPRRCDGRQYSIELASGRWSKWGVGTWHEWEDLVAIAARADVQQRNTISQTDLQPWLDRCRQAGFDVGAGEVSATGNCWGTFSGERYLLDTWTEMIVDDRFDARTLPEFMASRNVCISGATEEPPPRRPTLADIVFDPTPVVTTGRTLQASLF